MAKDYKPRTPNRYATEQRHAAKKAASSVLKTMLITASIIMLVVGVAYYWRGVKTPKLTLPSASPVQQTKISEKPAQEKPIEKPVKVAPPSPPVSDLPHFDFYTVLPEKEVIVPEHEINTRAREEDLGKAKATRYIIQAGSFKNFKEAEKQSLKLASMGMQASIQKAKVGDTTWYSVKMGAYTQMTSVSTIRNRLRQNGIDVMVTEVSN